MNVLKEISSAQGTSVQTLNIKLAEKICATNNKAAVKELVLNLHHKSHRIQGDCIKVLYETGERKPELISPYVNEFITLLHEKNNRMQWGAMCAIDSVTALETKAVYLALPFILRIAETGSVITKDHFVNILVRLCEVDSYKENCNSILIEQVLKSPVIQLPTYAEKTAKVITSKNSQLLVNAIASRLKDVTQEPKRKRLEKVMKKLNR